ncbi:MAG: hypothetical protein ACLUIO_23480 [Neglectibacter timonensis]
MLKGRAMIVNSMTGTDGNIFHALTPLDIMGLPDYLGAARSIPPRHCQEPLYGFPDFPERLHLLITTDPALCYSTCVLWVRSPATAFALRRSTPFFSPASGWATISSLPPKAAALTCPLTRRSWPIRW